MKARFNVIAFTLTASVAFIAYAQPGSGWDESFNDQYTFSTGRVTSLVVYDGDLYVGGYFSRLGPGHPGTAYLDNVNGIVKWDGTTWSVVGDGFENEYDSVRNPGYITSMCVHDGELYVAGEFNRSGSLELNNIAKWDGTEWSYVPYPSVGSAIVTGMESSSIGGDSRLFLTFDSANPNGLYRSGQTSPTTWSLYASSNSVGYSVTELDFDGANRLFFGVGGINSVASVEVNGLAHTAGDSFWYAVSETVCDTPEESYPGPLISGASVETFNNKLYVGEGWVTINFTEGDCVANPLRVTDAVDSTWHNAGRDIGVGSLRSWSGCGDDLLFVGTSVSLDSPGPGPIDDTHLVYALDKNHNDITFGDGIGYLAPGSTSANGHAGVYAIVEYGDHVYFGGSFVRVGETAIRNLARWSCQDSCLSADFNGDTTVDALDLLDFLDAYAQCENEISPCSCTGCTGDPDVNGDGVVDILDVLDFLQWYGNCGIE